MNTCPSCGKILSEDEKILYKCLTCNIRLSSAKPVVQCPYCHSTYTSKISAMSKAGSVALLGVFAMGKVSKQWHCHKCGSDF